MYIPKEEKKMIDCSYFTIAFQSDDGIKGELFSMSSSGKKEIAIDFKNGFGEFIICDGDFITDYEVDLMGKDSFIQLQKGDRIKICEKEVTITDFDCETVSESLEFWDRVEMEEWG